MRQLYKETRDYSLWDGNPWNQDQFSSWGKRFLSHSAQAGFRSTQSMRTVSLGEKQPDHEADHISPCSVKVKHVWWYTCTPPYTS
jgi:hypothetical protein